MSRYAIATLAFAAFAATTGLAHADPGVLGGGAVATCATLNCSATKINGVVIGEFNGYSNPWAAQFRLNPGKCARFDVFSATVDLEMVVVAPNGDEYWNDDFTGANPRVVIPATAITQAGVYTVLVNQWQGNRITNGFGMYQKQYNAANINCSSPTTASDTRPMKHRTVSGSAAQHDTPGVSPPPPAQ